MPSNPVQHAATRNHGSSLPEVGGPLDQERAASMADEGGVAGAHTDAASQTALRLDKSNAMVGTSAARTLRKAWPWVLVASGIIGGVALAAMVWQRNQRKPWYRRG